MVGFATRLKLQPQCCPWQKRTIPPPVARRTAVVALSCGVPSPSHTQLAQPHGFHNVGSFGAVKNVKVIRRFGLVGTFGRARTRAIYPLHGDRPPTTGNAASREATKAKLTSAGFNVSLSLPTTSSISFVVAPLQQPLPLSRQRTWWATMRSVAWRPR